jgi:hypothetical protein
MDYDQNNFSDRSSLAELRGKTVSMVVSVTVFLNAIPITLNTVFDLPEVSRAVLFWVLMLTGWISSALALSSAILFQSMVPRWTKDPKKGYPKMMDWLYPIAVICLGIAAITFTASVCHIILWSNTVSM